MAAKFSDKSDYFKIPFLRDLLSGRIDETLKKNGVQYTKKLQQQPMALNFLNSCLNAMVEPPEDGIWSDSIAGQLVKNFSPATGNENPTFIELKKLCQTDINYFISPDSDQDQCKTVGIVMGTGCKYDLKKTYPGLINGINNSRDLWTNSTWCNNCWLCGVKLTQKAGYPYTKQCEHILPYLTGSILLGTAKKTQTPSVNTLREYGQSHAVCNRFKNQGEFIKFDIAEINNKPFSPDTDQIINYVKELTGVIIGADGEALSPVVTNIQSKTTESFSEIYTLGSENVNLSRAMVARDMYKTIGAVTTTLCNDSLNKIPTDSQADFLAKLLYSTILNYLVNLVKVALLSTKGVPKYFKDKLDKYYNDILESRKTSIVTVKELAEAIGVFKSPYTTQFIINRLKDYINNNSVPKKPKHIFFVKNLYDKLTGNTSFGGRPAQMSNRSERHQGVEGGIKRPQGPLRGNDPRPKSGATARAMRNVVTGEDQIRNILKQLAFKNNLTYLVNILPNIIYGDLYSKLVYTTANNKNEEIEKEDDEWQIKDGILILPNIAYCIYQFLSSINLSDRNALTQVVCAKINFPYKKEESEKIFSAYVYGLEIFKLLDYDAETYIYEPTLGATSFGKRKRIADLSNEELKRKLHSVGMRVTKLTKYGRLKALTRRELQTSARIFKDLQLDAKKMNIRITYLSKDGSRKYKSYKRLLSDLAKGIKSSFGG